MSSSASAQRYRAVGLAWGILFAAGAGLSVVVLMMPLPPGLVRERALCDRAVNALLTSKDLVEVTRAGIIVDRLDCSIGRRLDSVETPQ
jgi:hypothetical protein